MIPSRCVAWFLALPLAMVAAAGWGADAKIEVDSELLKLAEPLRQKALADLTQPSTVRCAGGKLHLADAVALLAASGNATTLEAGIDAQQEAELPALVGSYWEAVRAVCDAFHLDIKPGVPRGTAQARAERAVAVQCGALELTPRIEGRHSTLVVNGAVLGVIDTCEVRHTVGARHEHVAELVMGLRIEPKINPDRIGGGSTPARCATPSERAMSIWPNW
jgi:hypothetical protein